MNLRQINFIMIIESIMNSHKSIKSPIIKNSSKSKTKKKENTNVLKTLNPDYYINLEKKKKSKKPKLDLIYTQYSSHKKLRSISQA